MIGGLTSSLALAQRTASQARVTMDTMSRQIATGQKVASVKDDGAAWTRANSARSAALANRVVADQIDWVKAGVGIHRASIESRIGLGQQSEQNALRAMDPSLSAQERATIDAEQTQISAQISDMSPTNHDDSISLIATSGNAWQPSGTNIADSNMSWLVDAQGTTMTTSLTAVTFQSATAMNSVASVAAATTTRANRAIRNAEWSNLAINLGGLERLMETQTSNLRKSGDRLEGLAASLTDADLGKVSTARAQAETRQQLALDTIKSALTAYGNYAGGLLGNVQRTQRGVLA